MPWRSYTMLIINHTLALSPYLYFSNLKIQQVLKRCSTSSSRFAHQNNPLLCGFFHVFSQFFFLIQEAVGLWIHIVRNQHRQVVGIGPQSFVQQAAPSCTPIRGEGVGFFWLPALCVPKFNVEMYHVSKKSGWFPKIFFTKKFQWKKFRKWWKQKVLFLEGDGIAGSGYLESLLTPRGVWSHVQKVTIPVVLSCNHFKFLLIATSSSEIMHQKKTQKPPILPSFQ